VSGFQALQGVALSRPINGSHYGLCEAGRGVELMEQSEVMERVVKILTPWVKDEAALSQVSMETNILDDLKVNSARLVDVVIAFEDDFDIEIADEDVDQVNTVGDAVNLISGKL
jgi:acyl carrier protein